MHVPRQLSQHSERVPVPARIEEGKDSPFEFA